MIDYTIIILGVIIFIIFCAVFGGIFGGMAAITAQKPGDFLLDFLMNFQPLWAFILGIGVYVLAGAAAMMLVRKMEVRV